MSTRILIVEDDDISRELARRILNRAGFITLETANGRDVMQIVAQEQPDLILMDYHLLDIDGIELTKQITKSAITKHIPIIALSADIYVRQRFIEAGASAFLAKPLGRRSLLATINTALVKQQLA